MVWSWFAAALAAAPELAQPGTAFPDRDWDVVSLDLDLKIDLAAQTVSGTATHTVQPLARASQWLQLHQRGLSVTAVKIDGVATDRFRIGEESLDVDLPADAKPHVVAIDYTATPRTGLHFRGQRGTGQALEVWSQGEDEDNRFWYPSWDHPSDLFTVTSHLTVKDGLVAVANGALTAKEPQAGGWTRWSWKLEQPVVNYLVAIAVGKHKVFTGAAPNAAATPLEVYLPADVSDEVGKAVVEETGSFLAWMEKEVDEPYPYAVHRTWFAQNFLYYGMENASLSTLTADHAVPRGSARWGELRRFIGHEAAHQWFGDLVTCRGWRNLWLNEALAEDYAIQWLGDDEHEAALRERAAMGAWSEGAPLSATHGAARTWFPADVYERGPTIAAAIRHYIGEPAWKRGVAAYLDRHKFGLVETSDLRVALEDASGRDLQFLFDQLVHSAAPPTVKASHRWSAGQLEITLEQPEGFGWNIPVEIEIGTAADPLLRSGWVGPGRTVVTVALAEAPRYISIDPAQVTAVGWDQQQSPAEWADQLSRSPSPAARLAAMRAFAKKGAPEDVTLKLGALLNDRTHPGPWRARVAQILGELRTDPATDALLQALREDPLSEVRFDAAAALSKGAELPRVSEALQKAALSDESPDVRAAAMASLSSFGTEPALTLALRATSGATKDPVELYQALRIIGKHGTAPHLAPLLRVSSPDRDIAMGASWSIAAIWERLNADDRESWQKSVDEFLAKKLDDADIRVRQTALPVLGRIGGPQASRALEIYVRRETVPELIAAAREASAAIRQRAWTPESPAPKVDEDRWRQELEALQRRIERLESWR